jgi:hypothetical protein
MEDLFEPVDRRDGANPSIASSRIKDASGTASIGNGEFSINSLVNSMRRSDALLVSVGIHHMPPYPPTIRQERYPLSELSAVKCLSRHIMQQLRTLQRVAPVVQPKTLCGALVRPTGSV